MILFSTATLVKQKEFALAKKVADLQKDGKHITVAAVLFTEDAGSVLYTNKKREAAERVGMNYQVYEFSMIDPLEKILQKIQELNNDPTVTGIIIQKPWRSKWQEVTANLSISHESSDQGKLITTDKSNQFIYTPNAPTSFTEDLTTIKPISFDSWWHTLTSALSESKDVDGLHPNTLESIKRNTWRKENRVLPATCKAVLEIMELAFLQTNTPRQSSKIAIIGKSELLGIPLQAELRNLHFDSVRMLGRRELKQLTSIAAMLTDFDVIVSSTGQRNLITGDMIKKGTIVIDVGEPQPDVEYISVKDKAGFLTPVPGGVGPMTIVCLLENAVELALNS